MSSPIRYPLRFGALKPLLAALGLGPSSSFVDLDNAQMTVKMGWGFRAKVARTSIRAARAYSGIPGGIGVHGFGGRWLVNGSAAGIVTMDIEPIARAYVMGIPVKLRRLSISLDEPERFIAEVAQSS